MKFTYGSNKARGGNRYEHDRITMEVDTPEDWLPEDGMFLVKSMVTAALGRRVPERQRARQLYRELYGEEACFDDLAPHLEEE